MTKTISFDKAIDILETATEILLPQRDDQRVLFKQWEPEEDEDGDPKDGGGTYLMEWDNSWEQHRFRAKRNNRVKVVSGGAWHALVLKDMSGEEFTFMPLQGVVIKEAL